MLRKLRNKKGQFGVTEIIAVSAIVGIVGLGFYKTAKDGTLKKNGETIWCKMKGGTSETCGN